jgi:hypothetical protein
MCSVNRTAMSSKCLKSYKFLTIAGYCNQVDSGPALRKSNLLEDSGETSKDVHRLCLVDSSFSLHLGLWRSLLIKFRKYNCGCLAPKATNQPIIRCQVWQRKKKKSKKDCETKYEYTYLESDCRAGCVSWNDNVSDSFAHRHWEELEKERADFCF